MPFVWLGQTVKFEVKKIGAKRGRSKSRKFAVDNFFVDSNK